MTPAMSLTLTSDTLVYSLVMPHMQLFPVALVNILDSHLTLSRASETLKLPLNSGCCAAKLNKAAEKSKTTLPSWSEGGVSEASLCTVKEGSQMQLAEAQTTWSLGSGMGRKKGTVWSMVVQSLWFRLLRKTETQNGLKLALS